MLRWQENSESVSVFNECITQKDREREGDPRGLCAAECGPALQCSWLTSIQRTVWSVCLHVCHGSFCCTVVSYESVCYFM